jgi:hypothetical protein
MVLKVTTQKQNKQQHKKKLYTPVTTAGGHAHDGVDVEILT